ncbi:hypothetical protein HETIRDRAFT_456334 [Heterobasidion irregulare TC 32-1]|uniref:Uncharacterized protein n=1 Tax=Heterobasidion irregulare (strain TC 32-1) TaxID=747525 RepID=W4JPL2_HETIT|nr:uncharacterized protein HETIRDRAFT_456334 [Heterobasidion irregulare TC 32-1]ETW74801.1 hypothetical protein HETIRDRAFT_456334 [Heterobasidion irregulare TC 32-1]
MGLEGGKEGGSTRPLRSWPLSHNPEHLSPVPSPSLPLAPLPSPPLRRPSLSPPAPPPPPPSKNPARPPPAAAPPTQATPLRPRSQYAPHLPPPAVPASYLIHALAHTPHALPASSTSPPKRRPSASQAQPRFGPIAPVRTPHPFAFAFAFAPPIHNPRPSPPAQRPPRKKAARPYNHRVTPISGPDPSATRPGPSHRLNFHFRFFDSFERGTRAAVRHGAARRGATCATRPAQQVPVREPSYPPGRPMAPYRHRLAPSPSHKPHPTTIPTSIRQ